MFYSVPPSATWMRTRQGHGRDTHRHDPARALFPAGARPGKLQDCIAFISAAAACAAGCVRGG